MSGFSAKANELLVEIYRNVQILEQNELKKQRLNISINEMHMIELIAKGKTGMTVSEIAQQLKVTKPSVTVAVNKLVQKGYCEKQRLPGDGRAVQVMLTPEGKKVEAFHRRCHRRIIAEICEDLSDPTKVNRSALQNAASVASMVLTTESLIADKKEPVAPAPAAPDMGGMY